MLKRRAHLYFNRFLVGSDDDVDSAISMTRLQSSVYDGRGGKFMFQLLDKSILPLNIRDHDAAASDILHLRQS